MPQTPTKPALGAPGRPPGFQHRIDAVPDAGRDIVFIDHAGVERVAHVINAGSDDPCHGIGDDRRLTHAAATHVLQPSKVMVWWRYR